MNPKAATLKNIGKNIVSLTTSEIVGRVLGSVTLLILPRYLGPADYGIYSLAISYFLLFSVAANYGLNGLFIKDVARDKTLSQQYYGTNIILKLLLTIFSFGMLCLALYLLRYPLRDVKIILMISSALFFYAITQTNSAVYRAYEKMEYNALLEISRSVLGLAGILLIVNLQGNIFWIASIINITYFLLAFLGTGIIHRKFFKIIWKTSGPLILNTFKNSTPFFLVSAVAIIQNRIDVIMISKLVNNTEVGIFSAANELINILYLIPNLVSNVLFPVFSRQYYESTKSLVASGNLTIKYMAIIGLPISAGIYFVAPSVIPLIYGADYANAVSVMRILGLGIFITFVLSLIAYVLTAADKIRHVTITNLLSILAHIALNFWLIPLYGAGGAAAALLISGCIGTVYLYRIYVTSFAGTVVLKSIIKPLLATLFMSLILWLVQINLPFTILLGVCSYTVALGALRIIDREEILMFRQMIPFLTHSKFFFRS